MLQNFNIPGQTGGTYSPSTGRTCKPYTVRAILDGEVIAQGECSVNAFTHIAYKACYDAIPAEYESRIDEILMVNQWGEEIPLIKWLKVNGF